MSTLRRILLESAKEAGVGGETQEIKKKDRTDYVCSICEEVGEGLLPCEGPCGLSFHPDCNPEIYDSATQTVTCSLCREGKGECFGCKEKELLSSGSLKKCASTTCKKVYHTECVRSQSLTRWEGDKFHCPLHICHRCTALGKNKQTIRCVRCPTAYHHACVPKVGVKIMMSRRMVCDAHGSTAPSTTPSIPLREGQESTNYESSEEGDHGDKEHRQLENEAEHNEPEPMDVDEKEEGEEGMDPVTASGDGPQSSDQHEAVEAPISSMLKLDPDAFVDGMRKDSGDVSETRSEDPSEGDKQGQKKRQINRKTKVEKALSLAAEANLPPGGLRGPRVSDVKEDNLEISVTGSSPSLGLVNTNDLVSVALDKPLPQSGAMEVVPTVIAEEQWVMCERCQKWRTLPSTVKMEELPDQWYCEMNIWDPPRATCDAPEVSVEQHVVHVAPVVTTANKKGAGGGGRGGRAGAKGNAGRNSPNPTSGNNNNKGVKRGGDDLSPREGAAKKANTGQTTVTTVDTQVTAVVAEEVQWVQCDAEGCGKWRKVPIWVDAEQLPEVWYCNMNDWDKERASCDVPEDTVTAAAPATAGSVYVMGSGNEQLNANGAAGRRNSTSSQGPVKKGRTLSQSSNLKPNNEAKALTVKKETQWVQCENPHCAKWRKLPPHIDPDLLPEKWYCSMNIWDPMHASCGAPEEKDDSEKPQRHVRVPRTGLWGPASNEVQPRKGKLSYRDLIFGSGSKPGPCHSVIFNAYKDSSMYMDPSKRKKRRKDGSDQGLASENGWNNVLSSDIAGHEDIVLVPAVTVVSNSIPLKEDLAKGDFGAACNALSEALAAQKKEESARCRLLDVLSVKPLTIMEIIAAVKKLALGGLDPLTPGTAIEPDIETKTVLRLENFLKDGLAKELPPSSKYPTARYTIASNENITKTVVASTPLKAFKPWKICAHA